MHCWFFTFSNLHFNLNMMMLFMIIIYDVILRWCYLNMNHDVSWVYYRAGVVLKPLINNLKNWIVSLTSVEWTWKVVLGNLRYITLFLSGLRHWNSIVFLQKDLQNIKSDKQNATQRIDILGKCILIVLFINIFIITKVKTCTHNSSASVKHPVQYKFKHHKVSCNGLFVNPYTE